MKNTYSFSKKIRMGWWLLRTKFISPKSRFIRFPFDIRGRKFIDLGSNLTTGVGCRFEAFSESGQITLFFGDNVQINDYVHICAMKEVRIGNNVLMAGKIFISDNSHGFYKGTEEDSSPDTIPIDRLYRIDPIKIEDNVWIGESVTIMPGVNIGYGSIIGSNSVVTKDVPSYTIALGNPAKVVKKYNLETKCWQKVNQ